MRPTSPPLELGIVIAAALIAAETLVVYPVHRVAPNASLGEVYLVGVLVVSSGWGLALGVVTAVSARPLLTSFTSRRSGASLSTLPLAGRHR
jgi:hypothetical protein